MNSISDDFANSRRVPRNGDFAITDRPASHVGRGCCVRTGHVQYRPRRSHAGDALGEALVNAWKSVTGFITRRTLNVTVVRTMLCIKSSIPKSSVNVPVITRMRVASLMRRLRGDNNGLLNIIVDRFPGLLHEHWTKLHLYPKRNVHL